MFNDNLLTLEDEIDFELGAGKVRKKVKKAFKKIGKGIAVTATGGLAGAAMLAKKKAGKTKLGKKAKSLAAKAKAALTVKTTPKLSPTAKPAKAPRIVKTVQAKTAGQCCDKDELAKLVAAKLVAQLGPPLDAANKVLKRFELQNTATYEHKKLMSDADFRREVLTRLARGAANGNASCERTIRVIMGR